MVIKCCTDLCILLYSYQFIRWKFITNDKKGSSMTGKACSTGKLLCSVLILCLLCTLCFAEEKKEETAFLRVENGILQPVIQYSSIRDPGFDNAVSENMTFCV